MTRVEDLADMTLIDENKKLTLTDASVWFPNKCMWLKVYYSDSDWWLYHLNTINDAKIKQSLAIRNQYQQVAPPGGQISY